jgi:hypothetical protein
MLALHPDRDVVIGVDTHNDTHTAAAVGATGAVLEHLTVPADPAGYSRLIGFGRRHDATLWASKAPAASVPDSPRHCWLAASGSLRSTARNGRHVVAG